MVFGAVSVCGMSHMEKCKELTAKILTLDDRSLTSVMEHIDSLSVAIPEEIYSLSVDKLSAKIRQLKNNNGDANIIKAYVNFLAEILTAIDVTDELAETIVDVVYGVSNYGTTDIFAGIRGLTFKNREALVDTLFELQKGYIPLFENVPQRSKDEILLSLSKLELY